MSRQSSTQQQSNQTGEVPSWHEGGPLPPVDAPDDRRPIDGPLPGDLPQQSGHTSVTGSFPTASREEEPTSVLPEAHTFQPQPERDPVQDTVAKLAKNNPHLAKAITAVLANWTDSTPVNTTVLAYAQHTGLSPWVAHEANVMQTHEAIGRYLQRGGFGTDELVQLLAIRAQATIEALTLFFSTWRQGDGEMEIDFSTMLSDMPSIEQLMERVSDGHSVS